MPRGRVAWFGATRSLDQQLEGLDDLLQDIGGRTVLDVGCAEGAISIALLHRGASRVFGVDVLPEFVDSARKAGRRLNALFRVADANTWRPDAGQEFDIVLMLAVLHKLRDPSRAARELAAHARLGCVVRLPPDGAPVIIDDRSGRMAHDIGLAMRQAGFELVKVANGPIAGGRAPEWTGYFARREAVDAG